MSCHVEADSLAEITRIASTIPKYPRNPTEKRRASLTLYISKVPGKRDIILSTLKPQLKNVTAGDVASSLYYFHVHSEEDAEFLDETTSEAGPMPVPKLVPRKPLPETVRSSVDVPSVNRDVKNAPPLLGRNNTVPKRKPVPSTMNITVNNTTEVSRPIPLGPRPHSYVLAVGSNRIPVAENYPTHFAVGSHSDPDPDTHPSKSKAHTRQSAGAVGAVAENSETHGSLTNKFSITVIRRDPSSGAQWNVGVISGQPINYEAQLGRPSSTRRPKKPYFEMSICLTAPSYVPFRNACPIRSVTKHSAYGSSEGISGSSSFTFDRKLCMEGSSFWSRASAHHKRTFSGLSEKNIASDQSRPHKSSRVGSLDGVYQSHGTQNNGDMEPKGYAFNSPWGGRCKFLTGGGGRSLRCQHTLTPPVSAANVNRNVDSQDLSVTVSELRFNLPSSAVFTPSVPSEKDGTELGLTSFPHFKHIRNKISSSSNKHSTFFRPCSTPCAPTHPGEEEHVAQSTSREIPTLPPVESRVNEESIRSHISHSIWHKCAQENLKDEARLDLSLGRESAGGGNRGKLAKLGKLIIHDEGFKMLDLVVSANMAVWWSVWECEPART